MIKNIIFDIGNVLAAFDWEGNLKKFGFSDEEYEAIADAVYRSEDWNEMDRGVMTTEEVIRRFCDKIPQYEKDVRRVISAYSGTIRQYPYTKKLIRTLKEKGYRVYYLSNYGEYAVQKTKKELDFTELMDGGLFSYEVKMVKPNRWLFAELMRRYQLKPEECLFFDDNPKNAEAACEIGMKGIPFCGYETALCDLKKLGIELNNILVRSN